MQREETFRVVSHCTWSYFWPRVRRRVLTCWLPIDAQAFVITSVSKHSLKSLHYMGKGGGFTDWANVLSMLPSGALISTAACVVVFFWVECVWLAALKLKCLMGESMSCSGYCQCTGTLEGQLYNCKTELRWYLHISKSILKFWLSNIAINCYSLTGPQSIGNLIMIKLINYGKNGNCWTNH